LPVVRAIIVLVLFVVVTVLVLGEIHPPAAKSASAAAPTSVPASPTSTTKPAHPSTTTTTIAPSKVSVLVANGTEVSGAAATITNQLQPAGWDLLTPVDASAQVPASRVYYVAGFQQPAATVATSLHLSVAAVAPYTTTAPISSIGTAEVVVVVGPNLASSASATTTSTAG
jgi:hypothetical protein